MRRYIDADALIEAIKNELWDWDSLDGITSAAVLKQTLTDIQNAPTADVRENVRAHWDRVEMKNGEWWHTCSKCKATWGSEDGELDFKFCPNCGAEMEDEDAEIH